MIVTNSAHSWSIATKTDPSKCDEKGDPGYTIFYKKNPPPPPPKVGTYTEISNSAPSKRAYACFDSVTVNKMYKGFYAIMMMIVKGIILIQLHQKEVIMKIVIMKQSILILCIKKYDFFVYPEYFFSIMT